MPTIDAQFYIQGGGVFVARYLSWREDRTDDAIKSSIACDPYSRSLEGESQFTPCVVSVFRCTFEGLHSESLPAPCDETCQVMGGGGAINLMGVATSEYGPTSSTIMHVAESVFRGCSSVRSDRFILAPIGPARSGY
jgi:hypothetical protein